MKLHCKLCLICTVQHRRTCTCETGLGICSFAHLLFALVALEKRASVSESLSSLFTKEGLWADRSFPSLKKSNVSNLLVIQANGSQKTSDSLKKIHIFLGLGICSWVFERITRFLWAKVRPEQFALGHKFFEQLARKKRTNHSHRSFLKSDSLFGKQQHLQIAHSPSFKWAILSEKANSQLCFLCMFFTAFPLFMCPRANRSRRSSLLH